MHARCLLTALVSLLLFNLATAQGPGRPRPDREGRPGPWNNDVLVLLASEAGGVERLSRFERAGVPTVARLQDDRLIAAFQHFPLDDDAHFDRIAVAFSNDEGRTWSKPAPIVVENLERGLMRPFDPTLVPLPDGRVRLYFTSNRSPSFRQSTPAIYSAISQDGVRYQFEPGVRFAVEGRVVIDCAVALHGDTFHLIVPDNGTPEQMFQNEQQHRPPQDGDGYHAISRDGLNFERVDDVAVDPRNRWLGNMHSDGQRLMFFGTGPGPWPLVSSDGKSWSAADFTVTVLGADPGAVKLRDGSWLLLATGTSRGGAAGDRQRPPPPRPRPRPNRRSRFLQYEANQVTPVER